MQFGVQGHQLFQRYLHPFPGVFSSSVQHSSPLVFPGRGAFPAAGLRGQEPNARVFQEPPVG